MPDSNPFEKIYPEVLENSAQEVGELVGAGLDVSGQESLQGTAADVFKSPKKKFVLAGFKLKGETADRVHLLVDLDAAIELSGRLIMLPADEIKAAKKQAKLEGELLDACSEIVNIITGTVNTALHEAFAKKKLHFTKGQIQVYPAKADDVPLSSGSQTCFSADLVLEGNPLGNFRFFFPHELVVEPPSEAEAPEAAAPGPESAAEQAREASVSPDPDNARPQPAEAASENADEAEPDREASAEAGQKAGAQAPPGPDPGAVDALLRQGLETAREELESLLGDAVSFTEQQTGHRKKADLLAKTRGKQVLTRIDASGQTTGQVFMLLPLKDAVYFGGVLLMMPAESIAETVKQGKFDGEVADAFGEVANILVGAYSNQFQGGAPIRLKLKKNRLETLVPAQVEPDGDAPFSAPDYYAVSARIRMGEKNYGPLELLFPLDLLGLQPQAGDTAEAGQKNRSAGQSQNAGPGQNVDTEERPQTKKPQARIVSIVGEPPEQFETFENSVAEEGLELARFSLDGDFKQELGRENPNCVFLFLNGVNEQGLAKTIKVRAVLKKDCPLIVAGAEWTRSTVLKARKYGATDILAMPAEKDVIRKKYRKYL